MRHPFVEYHQRILELNPIAYWPLDEKLGTVAYGWVSGRNLGEQNGTHTAVTLGQPGIGDGNTSASYDGATSYTNVQTASFAAAFSGAAGTVAGWLKMLDAASWQDATREFFRIEVDSNNFVRATTFANPNFQFRYKAGGTEVNRIIVEADTAWIHYSITWSKAADEVKVYRNAVQQGATLNGLGVWAGAPVTSLLGAASGVPATVWKGWLAHFVVWNRALSAAEIAALAVVE